MSTLIVNPIPLPYGDPLTAPRKAFDGRTLAEVIEFLRTGPKGFITDTWSQSFDQTQQQLASSPVAINQVSSVGANAAVATTDLAGVVLQGGLYEVRTYQQITTVDGVNSSLQITIGWTYNTVIQSETFTALVGDTLTTKLTGPSKVFRADAGSPITYAIAYASNTPAKMKYTADLLLSRVAP